jgi:adenine-specific DNA-methyltransferase
MKRLTAEDAETKTPDVVAENIEQLKTIFPEAFTEEKVDFEVLKQLLGGVVEEGEEKYGLNWHGKRRARQLALTPSTGTLRPCPEESVDWETTRNLMIEGDNLEVLKLLQKSYGGEKKVKLIYIDPPYNTGKDFVYPDDFRDNIKNYLELTGQVDGGGRKVSSNTEASGRFHTDWLNMMYPRLRLARTLLRDDGVIFISIDDGEHENLIRLCNEIFGEENFIANIVWQKKYAVSNDDPGIAPMHDFIVCYRKSEAFCRNLLPRTEKQTDRYTNLDNDPRGVWSSDNYISNKSKDERPTLWYPIKHPKTGEDVWPDEDAVWRYSKDKHLQIENENRLYWGPNQSYKRPRIKRFLSEVQEGVVPSTWWPFQEVGHNDEAQKETAILIGPKVFTTPKPLRMIRRILEIGCGKDEIVLDFFAGSGVVGQAVMSANMSDAGNRRFILVQLQEPTGREDFHNISEITKERLRRAGKKIREENPMFAGDLGFRVFKLASSNIRAWEPNRDDLPTTLHDSIEHLKTDRTEQDILFELLLKLGLDLTIPIEQKSIAGKAVHNIGAGTLLVCLAEQIAAAEVEPLALGIAAWHKELAPAGETTVVFRDSAFADDVAKTNLTAILQQHGLENVRSL